MENLNDINYLIPNRRVAFMIGYNAGREDVLDALLKKCGTLEDTGESIDELLRYMAWMKETIS